MKPVLSIAVLLLLGNCCEAEVDFDTEIVPILSKAGCNAASCHGSAAGQAGFRLSLFGGDAEFDYRTIVRELGGRRISHKTPAQSLLIEKPAGQLDHGGGEVLEFEGAAVRKISHWISEGAKRRQLRRITKLRVEPAEFVANTLPADFQLKVSAEFDDGLSRDVTSEAVYVSQNESAVEVHDDGAVKVLRSGPQNVIIRFCGKVGAVSVVSPIGSDPVELQSLARNNWIDDEVNAMLQTLRLQPGRLADDVSFLRRLALDLTGRMLSRETVERFAQDDDDGKRAKMIDSLLSSDEFVEFWTHQMASQLRLRSGKDAESLQSFRSWLERQVRADVGWSEIVRTLIMAEGDPHQYGPAFLHRQFSTPREEAEYVAEVMLGVRMRCANCHNHPLDRWTQDDYHGLAAIFAGFERGKEIKFTGRGTVVHPRTGAEAIARIPGERFLEDSTDDKRDELVSWLTDSNNPYFARAMTGRVWQLLMGRGLVTPVDDLRDTNPASHPKLEQRLATHFVQNQTKLRPLIRLICNSAAYQRSSIDLLEQNEATNYYAIFKAKPLPPEVLADAIGDATGVPTHYGEFARAIQVTSRADTFEQLQFLGQCMDSDACSADSGASTRGIASHLHFMNGDLLNRKIQDNRGRLNRMVKGNASTREIVEQFYWASLGRSPSSPEVDRWLDRIGPRSAEEDWIHRCEDFVWAMLNSREFNTNH